jgi:hypothetical protein
MAISQHDTCGLELVSAFWREISKPMYAPRKTLSKAIARGDHCKNAPLYICEDHVRSGQERGDVASLATLGVSPKSRQTLGRWSTV